MRTIYRVLVCLALSGAATEHATATFMTGQRLHEYMRDYTLIEERRDGNVSRSGVVLGYVTGVVDANAPVLCVPSGVSAGQLVAVVRKYLAANPEIWNLPADVVVTLALGEAFPCPKK